MKASSLSFRSSGIKKNPPLVRSRVSKNSTLSFISSSLHIRSKLVFSLAVINIGLLAWYMFSVNMYAGLNFEQSRLSGTIAERRAKLQELKVVSAGQASVARAQDSLNLTEEFVATGVPEIVSLGSNSKTQLTLR